MYKLIFEFVRLFLYKNIPAIAALTNEANVPAITALNANFATMGLLLGAIEPSPPINIAIELRLAKPHKAKLIIKTVFSDSSEIIGAKFE